METIVETYRGFNIELFLSVIDDVVRYRSYNPEANYVIPGLTIEEVKKKIDERYKSR